jgi:hypothetical protein
MRRDGAEGENSPSPADSAQKNGAIFADRAAFVLNCA